MTNDIIQIGNYIIVQKHNYKKLHKLNKLNSYINLGRDSVNLSGIECCPYFSVFKMIPKNNKRNREYDLELTEGTQDLKDEIDVKMSGTDNRNILDDGRSQKLSAIEIEDLKKDSNKASAIIETLISNSNTFHNKTEFSQEKYLRKKEKKYFEYLQILKPNLRLISEILYRLDPGKIQGIRIDTLSQIITSANINCDGIHMLYDSGSNGLLAAAILNAIGENTTGKLIHIHPGNMSQKQALLAMNFTKEHYNRCISVNVYSVLRQFYQGCDTNSNRDVLEITAEENALKRKAAETPIYPRKVQKQRDCQEISSKDEKMITECDAEKETKIKPKWHYDNITASELLHRKVDSLIIACKEDPQNIFNELVISVKPGRPFVIYCNFAEPLQNLYMTLKSQNNVAALKLTCNWMRNYQVLADRTHPEVMMNGSSGFLLTGYVLK